MSSCFFKRVCCCFRKPEDKQEVEKIKSERNRFEEIMDMETLFKSIKKLSFFQDLLLKKLEVEKNDYIWGDGLKESTK